MRFNWGDSRSKSEDSVGESQIKQSPDEIVSFEISEKDKTDNGHQYLPQGTQTTHLKDAWKESTFEFN